MNRLTVNEARREAEMWRGLAWIMSEALLKWDQMTEDDKAKTLASIAELTPSVLQLPWEDATPDGQAPQWALDIVAKESSHDGRES